MASIATSAHLLGASDVPGPIPVEQVRVIDGDTIEVRALIWPGHYVQTRVRLADVDTPETRRPACEAERRSGFAATDFTQSWLAASEGLQIRNVRLGSFAGRVIADLERSDGARLSDALLSAELATPYGETGSWCVQAQTPDASE